ncbi:MAG: GNAT family N-acetyltransferase [Oscillospiraceae bacterium]
MSIQYRRAGISDLDNLVAIRVKVLKAANLLPDNADLSEVESESRDYYSHSLADGSHIAYLVYDGDKIVGAGGMSLYRVLPTCHNPSGRKAYIMNMYTDPDYRRRGIGRKLLDLLVQAVREEGISYISLEATEMGRPLYEKYGFIPLENEMYLL